MKMSRVYLSKIQLLFALQIIAFAVAVISAPGSLAKSGSTQPAESKKAGVELTEGTTSDPYKQTLNEVVAPSYQTPTPQASKIRQEIMDDLEHKSEPEPFCYYPI